MSFDLHIHMCMPYTHIYITCLCIHKYTIETHHVYTHTQITSTQTYYTHNTHVCHIQYKKRREGGRQRRRGGGEREGGRREGEGEGEKIV